MINTVVYFVMLASLIITTISLVYTLKWCENQKRLYFILLLTAVLLFIMGYLLEITSTSEDGGLVATKVQYAGAVFISPIFLLFILDYCDIKVGHWLTAALFIIPPVTLALVWTSEYHHLFYTGYFFNTMDPVHHLEISPSPLYYVFHIYSNICLLGAFVLVIWQYIRGRIPSKRLFILMLAVAAAPFAVTVMHITGARMWGVNFTPICTFLVTMVFFVHLVYFNIFDVIPRARDEALSAMKEAHILVDEKQNILSFNAAAQAIFPDLRNTLRVNKVTQLQDWPRKLTTFSPEAEDNEDIKFTLHRQEREIAHYNASITPVPAPNGQVIGWNILIQNVTSVISLMTKLEGLAFTDGLTEIYNKRFYMDMAAKELMKAERNGESACVVMFDIDHFKLVNDTYGHAAGDAVLKMVAKVAKEALRPYDLFARYGGEEFVYFIGGLTDGAVIAIAERIRTSLEKSVCMYEGQAISVTVSLGAATFIREYPTLDKLIRYADMAMYKAKNSGRNRTEVYTPDLGE